MGVYTERILPFLIHAAMRQDRFDPYRRRLARAAEGRALEIGIGSGLNVKFYASATRLIGVDPSRPLLGRARRTGQAASFPVALLNASADAIPLEEGSVDTAVTSWTLCSVPEPRRALEEIRRVLKPSGRLLFVEHGLSPDGGVGRWQDRLTPVWRRIAGGCHLNRPVARLVEDAGFRIERLETGYMEGPRPMTFMYEGTAVPR